MTIIYSIIFFLLGASLTSFYQLIAERIPNNQTIFGRSNCDYCKHQLKLIDVLPILGFVLNKGKCKYCKHKISIKYPIIELLGGTLFLLFYLKYGLSLQFLTVIVLISVLMIESISDLMYRYVIDAVWIVGFILLLIVRIIDNNILIYLFSSFTTFIFLFIIAYFAEKILKKEALGGGDIKLFLFIGLGINIINSFLALFLASLLALIYALVMKKTKEYIPLIPFISISVLLVFCFGNQIIQWYLGLLGM